MPNKEAIVVLVALTSANLLNYFDRYIPSVTKELIKESLHLSDFETGIMFTAFISCYMVVSPIVGFLADMRLFKRKYVIVAGVLVWSVATAGTALCKTFWQILIPRVVFGIGEAAFTTLAPAVLSDYFPPEQRNIVMAVFLGATPIGCAIGYGVAGTLGQAIGWRNTFLICSTPGVFALGLLFIREPEPGEKDPERKPDIERKPLLSTESADETRSSAGDQKEATAAPSAAAPSAASTKMKKKGQMVWGHYVVGVAGYVVVTFGMGGFADWLPTFFVRYHGQTLSHAGLINGAIVVIGGMAGTILGSLAGDAIKKVLPGNPYLLMSGITMICGGVAGGVALFCFQDSLVIVQLVLGAAVLLGWCYNGPINAIILNSSPPHLRAIAMGISVLSIHLFGDAISPSIIGAVSDATRGDLRGALFIVPCALVLSGFIWFLGWICLPPEPATPTQPKQPESLPPSPGTSAKSLPPINSVVVPAEPVQPSAVISGPVDPPSS